MRRFYPFEFNLEAQFFDHWAGFAILDLEFSWPELFNFITMEWSKVSTINDGKFWIGSNHESAYFLCDEYTGNSSLIWHSRMQKSDHAWTPTNKTSNLDWLYLDENGSIVHSFQREKGHPVMQFVQAIERLSSENSTIEQIEKKLSDLGYANEKGQRNYSFKGMHLEYGYFKHEYTFGPARGILLQFFLNGISRPFEKFSADFYKVVLNSAAVDIAVFDVDARYMLINEFAVKNKEIRNWLIGRTDFDYCKFRNVDDTLAKSRRIAFQQSLEERRIVEIDEEITDKEGNKHYSVKRFKPIVIDNEVKFMMGFGIDVTPLKQVQNELSSSEEKYRELFESSLDIIQSVDKSGKLLFVNKAWIDAFGFEEYELDNLNLFQLIDASSLSHCQELFVKVLNGESVIGINALFKKKNGQTMMLEGNVVPRIVEGEVIATHAFFRDITEREEKDEQLRKSLLEKEVLLGEIHHRVKNNLTVVYSLLELQAFQEKNEEIIAAYRESQSRIKAMALVHEMLYQSHAFEAIDLYDYVKKLSEHLKGLLAVKKQVELEVLGAEVRLPINQAVTCGLFANEVLTNAFKYAVPHAREPKVFIDLHLNNDQVVVYIGDNGPGLGDDGEFEKKNSLGFKLMRTFASQLKGNLDIRSNNGLHYTLTFKRA
jgi:PAS domain S-box-containing protein